MENPATWGPVEKTINKAMNDWEEAHFARPPLAGASEVYCIAAALREAGLLKETDEDS
jgi:hypothetical protein